MAGMRRYRRFLLLVVLPLVAAMAGVTFYLNGGRYVTTDDAYVGAQKVLITPDISGKIEKVVVKEGQQVKIGDVLFEIDPVPFRLAVAQARRRLAQAKVTYDNLIADLKIYGQMSDLAQQGVDLKRRDVDRKIALVKNNFGSQLDLDNAATGLVTASAQMAIAAGRRLSTATAQLLGNPDAAARANSRLMPRPRRRSIRPSAISITPSMRAPMDGIATQVEQIQLGRFVMAGAPVFSIIDASNPWVDANPKESDFTYVAVGQTVTLDGRCLPQPRVQGHGRLALAPAPARNSRSCRRRTRPAISSRWCSASRCGSISTRTTSSSAS